MIINHMEDNTQKEKKEAVSINFRATPQFKKMIEDIGLARGGMNQTETIKFCVSEYYYGEYRKQTLGYFAGHAPEARRTKKAAIQEQLDAIDVMNDKDLTEYIHSSGLIKPEDEEQGTFFARTDEATGIRMIAFKYHGQASVSDRWTMGELKGELEKHLKDKMRNSKVS